MSVAELEREFGISPMTARRDLTELARQGVARRTHGGAVLPDIAAHEDSFTQRLGIETEAKEALAAAAVSLIGEKETIFLDSSTTSYVLARRIVESGAQLTLITNSLPVMDLVATAAVPGIELIGAGGSLRRLTRSFVGPVAVDAIRAHFADRLFLSAKGITGEGNLSDADPLEAEVKRAMIEQAAEATLLVDASKFAVRGLSSVAHLADLAGVVAYGFDGPALDKLRSVGARLRAVGGGAGGGHAEPAPGPPAAA